jgi:hypothetical protein
MMCDYYGLKYHIPDIILGITIDYSKNFFQKRRLKDLVNLLVDEDTTHKIISRNNKLLENLGPETVETICVKKLTTNSDYHEPLIQILGEGLILQGFYQNCISFCSGKQCQIFFNAFLDYENFLNEYSKPQGYKISEEYKYFFLKC